MAVAYDLGPEWERIDLLGACLSIHRSGGDINDEMKSRLGQLQTRVNELRQSPPWLGLSQQFQLSPLDQDILACTLAPEAEPRLGWMYQELQPGLGSAFPSPALIREILFLQSDESRRLQQCLQLGSPLLRSGLLQANEIESFQALRPGELALQHLLGWQGLRPLAPPGSIEIPVRAGWADLVLPASSLRAMEEMLLWITQRHKVVEEWGGSTVGGPVALFSGPSGTGKTYAAEVIAHALGWSLYRVDLGRLVSKYIGETEKNLNALFDAASGRPMVLLFDEADSIFGKRAEVKDARDRYANMEVSHLLSRIERHDGPCILTTNLRQHIDTAFSRRFQTVIEFTRPDGEARLQLWQKHLPPRAPLSDALALNTVAAAVELTGGQIRNAALQAAYLAAAEDRAIDMGHIARAVRIELEKGGREVTLRSLGELAEFLDTKELNG